MNLNNENIGQKLQKCTYDIKHWEFGARNLD